MLVIVVTQEDEFLLMERTRPAGFWQSVTGSLEEGETPAQAAHRELVEETGIQMIPVDRRVHVDFPIREPWRERYAPEVETNREHVFSVILPTRVPVILDRHEHVRFDWLARDKALQRLSSPTNRNAVERTSI